MRIGSFNIFHFENEENIQRSSADDDLIEAVIAKLDADVVLLQEIHSQQGLSARLADAGDRAGRSYVDPARQHDVILGTGWKMKTGLAFDRDKIEMLEYVELRKASKGSRRPLACHLRHLESGWEFIAIGVHLKSPYEGLGLPASDPDSKKRTAECELLAQWLRSKQPGTGLKAGPVTEDVVLVGDFNELASHSSLGPLTANPGAAWTHHQPVPLPQSHGQWTTFYDEAIIDHVFTSQQASARLIEAPRIYAFDHDPEIADSEWLHSKTDFEASLWGSWEAVPNLYRVSDHRPVSADFREG